MSSVRPAVIVVAAEVYWAKTAVADTLPKPAISAENAPWLSSNAVSVPVATRPKAAPLTSRNVSASAGPSREAIPVPTMTTFDPSRLMPTVPLTARFPSTSKAAVPLARTIRPFAASAVSRIPVPVVAVVSTVRFVLPAA